MHCTGQSYYRSVGKIKVILCGELVMLMDVVLMVTCRVDYRKCVCMQLYKCQ